eukprot:6763640-Prymnesium_polylepis.1
MAAAPVVCSARARSTVPPRPRAPPTLAAWHAPPPACCPCLHAPQLPVGAQSRPRDDPGVPRPRGMR